MACIRKASSLQRHFRKILWNSSENNANWHTTPHLLKCSASLSCFARNYGTTVDADCSPVTVSVSQQMMKKPERPVNYQTHMDSRGPSEQDLLCRQILKFEDCSTLHAFIEKLDYGSFDSKVTSACSEALFEFAKNEKSTAVKKDMLNSVALQKWSKLTRNLSRHMEIGEIINAAKLLIFLNAPGSNATMKILLRLILKQANSLSIQEIVYINFLLSKMPEESRSPFSQALFVALPVVFETQIKLQIDRDKVSENCDYLNFATKKLLSDKTIELLVNALHSRQHKLSAENAMSIIWSLTAVKIQYDSAKPLIESCFKKMTDSIDSLSSEQLSTTLSKCCTKFLRRQRFFYHEDFVEAACGKLMSRYTSWKNTLYGVKRLSIFNHLNIEYMDRVASLISEDPSLILNNDVLFEKVFQSFSNLNYKPEKWNILKDIFMEHPCLTKEDKRTDVDTCLNFLILDAFPSSLVTSIFAGDNVPALEKYSQRHSGAAFNLVLLYNAVEYLFPTEYNGPLPPKSLIESCEALISNTKTKEYPLKGALEVGFGGQQYVLTEVIYHGIHVDHGIVMRKGGFPIAMSSDDNLVGLKNVNLTTISLPQDSVIVLVKTFSRDSYASNTSHLLGRPALELKILESLGHPVIVIDTLKWTELHDREKIPYLMQKIREKTEKYQWNTNSGDVIPP